MDISKLSYEKSDGSKELIDAKYNTAQPTAEEAFTNTSVLSESYQKPMPEVEVLRIFVISGGVKREPDYFKLLQKSTGLKRIMVVVRSKKGQGLHPVQMSEMASKFYSTHSFETEEGNSYKLFDEDPIYLLSDLDEFGEDLCILVKTETNQQVWIVSNPCFEIWLFYHYFNSPMPLLEEGLTIELPKRSQWMKQKLHELHPTDSAKALLDMQTAIKNSKANFQICREGLPDVFSTQMHYFAEHLLDVIGKDNFEAMIKKQHDKAEYYRILQLSTNKI